MKNKYPYEKSPKPKGTCPDCHTQKSFRFYEGLPREFGICDRKNNCGFHNYPTKEKLKELNFNTNVLNKKPMENKIKIIYPSETFCKPIIANQSSNFHLFTNNLGITEEHKIKWNCGSQNSNTCFVYMNEEKVFVNIVFIEYYKNGKRNRDKSPYSLKATKTEKYSLSLYGAHLLSSKIIILTESEKCAIIGSFFYPQYDWLATGGANKLTDDKIHILFKCQVIYLCDADKAGRENSNINKLKKYEIDFIVLDLFKDRDDGYDIADAISDGLRPEIKFETSSIDEELPIIKDKPEDHNINNDIKITAKKSGSEFDRVEKYLSTKYDMRFNVVSNTIEIRNLNSHSNYETLNENDIYIELEKEHFKFTQAKIKALFSSKFVKTYDPFLDYFESLGQWLPNEEDFILKLCTYLPVKSDDSDRLKIQLKKMLVRSIACSLDEDEFNKQAFIIIHDKQNSGKSTFCRWLCPPILIKYFQENICTDKDSLISLTENFIINMDEMSSLNKVEINALKAIMSKLIVKIRRPYAAKTSTANRRANFVGNTNRTEFLNDETGSVRWICFELIDKINFDYVKDIDIDNIWKQAYTLYKQGFEYQLTPNEIDKNEIANKVYQVISEEQELVQLNYTPASREEHDAFYSATQIISALSPKYPSIKLNIIRMGKAMKSLGFKQEQVFMADSGYQVRGYFVNLINN